MKRQSLDSQYGFTLFELMIVITIFIAFIGATNIFNNSPQTDIEKADRMKVAVADLLRSEIQNIAVGKMPNRNGEIASTIQIDISTGALLTRYITGGTQIFSKNFFAPYFDGDTKYEIKTLSWTGSINPANFYTGSAILLITGNGIVFSGSHPGIENNMFLEVKVGYLTRARKIVLDRRTGKISETKFY